MSKKLPADLIFNQFIYHGDAIPRHISHLVLEIIFTNVLCII